MKKIIVLLILGVCLVVGCTTTTKHIPQMSKTIIFFIATALHKHINDSSFTYGEVVIINNIYFFYNNKILFRHSDQWHIFLNT